jgi:branched-chain amino acid transport system permease protein
MSIINQLYIGFSLGALYALIALGFSMVYGVLRLLNFAHSELITIGAYTSFSISQLFFDSGIIEIQDAILLLALSAIVSGIFGVLFFFIGYKSLYEKSRIAVLISAIGISVFIQNIIIYIYGAKSLAMPISNLDYSLILIIILGVATASVFYFLKRSMLGVWIRAVSDNYETAKLMGINPNKVIVTVFFIGGALAGIAGSVASMQYGTINSHMGYFFGLKAFAIAVVGGIGNLKGAILVGLFLGIIEVILISYLPDSLSHFKDAFAFCTLLLLLLIKPFGLFTKYLV